MHDTLDQEIRTGHALQAEAQELDERAARWAQVADRLTTVLLVVEAEIREKWTRELDRKRGRLPEQKRDVDRLVESYRTSAATLRRLALHPPAALFLSDPTS